MCPQGRAIVERVEGPAGGMRGAALGSRAQGEVHFEADVVLEAQDPHDAGPGQRDGREPEGGPGLEPHSIPRGPVGLPIRHLQALARSAYFSEGGSRPRAACS